MDMNEIIMKVSDLTGVSVTDILSRKRTQEICEARQIFIYMSHRALDMSQTNIALYLNRTRQNISRQIIVFDEQLRIYKGLQNKVDDIEKKIFPDN